MVLDLLFQDMAFQLLFVSEYTGEACPDSGLPITLLAIW